MRLHPYTNYKVPGDLKIPRTKVHELMEKFSHIIIKYLTHVILYKTKAEKNMRWMS